MNKTFALLASVAGITLVSPAFAQTAPEDHHERVEQHKEHQRMEHHDAHHDAHRARDDHHRAEERHDRRVDERHDEHHGQPNPNSHFGQ